MELSIVVIRTHNFTAKLIHAGMWLYCVLRGLKPEKTYNHTEIRVGENTSGAISPVVKTRNWYTYWTGLKKAEKLVYRLTLTPSQLKAGMIYLKEAEGTPYEYSIFLTHTGKIFTGRWKGDKTARKVACYEHMLRFLKATLYPEIDVFMNPYQAKKMLDKLSQ